MWLSRQAGKTRPMAAAVGLLVLAGTAACSSSGGSSLPTQTGAVQAGTSSAPGAAATAVTTVAVATTAAADASGIAGTWNGKYSGSYQGTFVLDWQQSGSTLSGTIQLSAPSETLPINGSVDGDTIKFGTVGSEVITYSGSVNGGSMSGSYSVQTDVTVGGSWSATKVS
jgi:hypothetical protein